MASPFLKNPKHPVGKAQTATMFSILALGWILAISGVMWLVNAFRAFSWHGFFLLITEVRIKK
jgi:uncharacterized membrane protein HdeD (DUF308 family)